MVSFVAFVLISLSGEKYVYNSSVDVVLLTVDFLLLLCSIRAIRDEFESILKYMPLASQ